MLGLTVTFLSTFLFSKIELRERESSEKDIENKENKVFCSIFVLLIKNSSGGIMSSGKASIYYMYF